MLKVSNCFPRQQPSVDEEKGEFVLISHQRHASFLSLWGFCILQKKSSLGCKLYEGQLWNVKEIWRKGIFFSEFKPDINSPDISPPDLCSYIWTEEESKKSNFLEIFHLISSAPLIHRHCNEWYKIVQLCFNFRVWETTIWAEKNTTDSPPPKKKT